ncbi:growth arrest and DNA damage-inducible protein GADD45 alpha-like isoform X1 [Mya arenaria]|uniref:growth arrest and DNA damage-inducible protein GADD45 alpha-like isoform X1 n=1 Tax=Mya arenaria TaxID=6604 RepID=UPI0022E570A3|nr:growth arrest and DNA damage-inducible protein GADD45 alpha-like isoform X1 [Mya arenaria]
MFQCAFLQIIDTSNMTLTDNNEPINADNENKSILDVGNALVHVVKEALSQGRVTFGIFECVEVLETCPEQVMLCVLPTVSDENILNLVNIQHKLIEAHCWENEVNLVKVDSSQKLLALLTQGASNLDRTADLGCLLVGYPTDDMSKDDFQITKLSYLFNEQMEPIALPD